jgi:hypothetical protein
MRLSHISHQPLIYRLYFEQPQLQDVDLQLGPQGSLEVSQTQGIHQDIGRAGQQLSKLIGFDPMP